MNVVRLLVLLAVTAASQNVLGETLQTCAAVENAEGRLACYDEIAKAATTTTETTVASQWKVDVQTSPIDDTKNVFLTVVGENGLKNRYGQEADLSFYIACRENVTSAFFVFGGHFMSDIQGRGQVTYRVDQAKARSQSFTVSTDNEALGLWSGGSAIPFIKGLFGGKRMYVEATPFSESTVSDFLPVSGLEEAIAPLRESCGW